MSADQVQVTQGTAIALLQQAQQGTDTTLREITRQVSEGFASVNVKIDRVNELALGMSQLQTRLEAQNEGLIRAFATMEDIKRDAKLAESENDKWRVLHGQDIDQRFSHRDGIREKYIESQTIAHNEINKQLSIARGVIIGITFAGGLIVGMLWWNVNQWVTNVQQQGQAIQTLQLENVKAAAQKKAQ